MNGWDREVRSGRLWGENGEGLRCDRCGCELEIGDAYGTLAGETVCADCADEEWAELTGEEKLELLGFEVERVRER